MSAVTTHVLDTTRGAPATGVDVALERAGQESGAIASGRTDSDGRIGDLGPDTLEPGAYRLRFTTAAYFARLGVAAFFPEIVVVFEVTDPEQHYHVPVLLSPFGYSTYRGT